MDIDMRGRDNCTPDNVIYLYTDRVRGIKSPTFARRDIVVYSIKQWSERLPLWESEPVPRFIMICIQIF